MLIRCPKCDLLGAHRHGCSRADFPCSRPDIQARSDTAAWAERYVREIRAKRAEPHPYFASLLRDLVGFAIAATCGWGFILTMLGLKNQSMLGLYGVLLIVGSWI